MHARTWLAASAVLLTAGCTAEATPVALPAAAPSPVEVAAASSGGACRLLDFAVIAKHTGARFDVAASVERGDTHTCVLRAGAALLPELILSVTETSIDTSGFTKDVLPTGAKKVTKLGKAAYRHHLPKAGKAGPVAEVGWLATDGRLATLRWTCPDGAQAAEAEEMTGKLVNLAKLVDTRRL
ncbi:hypothetical protein [Micromonospora eburnea]|uniref:DUF3558 domain-containing protein n=1 Tax=Micromonospora eburnea TaxID=227316 RepID=A0A1C6U0R1_9ACTN|nr:hypothetical protein [Micromonospora eburnea]SCL47488.1 hypothetical protein GA0070604_1498 [Micromonospora eburnea]